MVLYFSVIKVKSTSMFIVKVDDSPVIFIFPD
jgi:hypothetical protein